MLLPEITLLLGHDLHDPLPVFVDRYHENGRNGFRVFGEMLVDSIFKHEESHGVFVEDERCQNGKHKHS